MMKVRFTVPVVMETTIHVGENPDTDAIYDECIKMIEQADIKEYEEEFIDIDWDTIEDYKEYHEI